VTTEEKQEIPQHIQKAIKEQAPIINKEAQKKMLENCLWMMREHGFTEKEVHTIVRNLFALIRY
jgi:DNA replicative helicase MCM subunit Mcm2 (Cdc46/Mcm family)